MPALLFAVLDTEGSPLLGGGVRVVVDTGSISAQSVRHFSARGSMIHIIALALEMAD